MSQGQIYRATCVLIRSLPHSRSFALPLRGHPQGPRRRPRQHRNAYPVGFAYPVCNAFRVGIEYFAPHGATAHRRAEHCFAIRIEACRAECAQSSSCPLNSPELLPMIRTVPLGSGHVSCAVLRISDAVANDASPNREMTGATTTRVNRYDFCSHSKRPSAELSKEATTLSRIPGFSPRSSRAPRRRHLFRARRFLRRIHEEESCPNRHAPLTISVRRSRRSATRGTSSATRRTGGPSG